MRVLTRFGWITIALSLLGVFASANAETITYEYDANGNVLIRQTPSQTDTAGYDSENRITIDTSGDGLQRQFQYDPNGNRTQYQVDNFSETLTYAPNTNRLTNRDTVVIQTDAAGNITDDGQYLYAYNNAGRLKQIRRKSDNTLIGTYVYDDQGLRTRKVTQEGTTIFHYDIYGHLIAEMTDTGITKREYIYLDDRPLAQIDIDPQTQFETITYLHTDHLNTPRVGTDANQNVVWVWRGEAFGSLQPEGSVTINLRFPGMYFDQETGLYYNWNRYYSPALGRYITSDPVGLNGGLGTYSYASNNPMRFFDPTGLVVIHEKDGVKFDVKPGVGGGQIEHARAGAGEQFHFQLKIGSEKGPRIGTDTFLPLTPDDERLFTGKYKKVCESLTSTEKSFLKRSTRDVFFGDMQRFRARQARFLGKALGAAGAIGTYATTNSFEEACDLNPDENLGCF